MFECQICGNKSSRSELVSEVFTIEERRVLVERIPAQVCDRCGEPIFAPETAETIRKLIHGESSPLRTESLEVFALD
jgi:YgiT-type zinc finger domain-containing protein